MFSWLTDRFASQSNIDAVKGDIMEMAQDDYIQDPNFDLATVEQSMDGIPLSKLLKIRQEWEER